MATQRRDFTFGWRDENLTEAHGYLMPAVLSNIARLGPSSRGCRVFDLGCGNGSVAAVLAERGFQVVGVDPSDDGIALASKHYPHLRLEKGSAYEDLAERFGTFEVVTSLEVIEHLYFPHKFARAVFDLLEPSGIAIISTPYHSYLKNLGLSLFHGWDNHHHPLRDHGHIKFWSCATLKQLLAGVGFGKITFTRVGRIPPLAKSVVAIAERPAA